MSNVKNGNRRQRILDSVATVTCCRYPTLKTVIGANLDDARTMIHSRHLAEGGVVDDVVRSRRVIAGLGVDVERRMVHEVRHVEVEIELVPFMEDERFLHRQVPTP